MISYGRGALYENKAVFDRHKEYANQFESLKILYLTKSTLKILTWGTLVLPQFLGIHLICLFKSIFKNYRGYQIVTTQDPFITEFLAIL